MTVEELMKIVKREQNREDKVYTGLEINIRERTVVVNFLYEDNFDNITEDEYIQHAVDPVFLNEDELDQLIIELKEKNIQYNLRKDEFL